MTETMKQQAEGRFQDMDERDKEIQASVWALIFLVAEISLALRTIRDKLHERGSLHEEDEQEINRLACDNERMRTAYAHVEKAFQAKYTRIMDAMLHPEEVTKEVEEEMKLRKLIDLNKSNVPMVSGTNPEGG